MVYNIDWTSNNSAIGKAAFTLADNTIDSTHTSLRLTGAGVVNYGEIQQENFVHLLEHHAAVTPPVHPTVGQTWFNTADNLLYICVNPIMVNANTTVYFTTQTPGYGWIKAGLSITSSLNLGNNTIDNVADAVNLDQAVSAKYFYDHNFLNFEPKVGRENYPYVNVSSKFKASWYEYAGVMIVNEYDQECYYFTASDGSGNATTELFKAFKYPAETSFTFLPEPIRPPFLSQDESIIAAWTATEHYMFVTIYNRVTAVSITSLILTNNNDNINFWTRRDITTITLRGQAQFLLDENRILDVYPSGNNLKLDIYELSTLTKIGATIQVFNIDTEIDYTSSTYTMTSKSIRRYFSFYNKFTKNLIIAVNPIGYYKRTADNGGVAYKITTFTLSYDVSPEVLTNNTGVLTPLIPYSSFIFFTVNAYYDGNSNFQISFSEYTKTLYICTKNWYSQVGFYFNKQTETNTQITNRTSFGTGSPEYKIPDSSPWSKSVYGLILFPNNICMFAGNSSFYGPRNIIAEYTIVGNKVEIVPGRWRLTDTKPPNAPASVLDNAIQDVSKRVGWTSGLYTNVTFDSNNNPLFLYGGAGLAIVQAVINPVDLTVTFSSYGMTAPVLPASYSARPAWGYDPKRNIFYFLVVKLGEFNSVRLLAYDGTTWFESALINESLANASRSSHHNTTIAVNAGLSTTSNLLIDKNGFIYVNQTFTQVGGVFSGNANKIGFDGSTFTITPGASVTPYASSFIYSYCDQGYNTKKSYLNDVRTFRLSCDLDSTASFIVTPTTYEIWTNGSVGLIAYLAAQDIFVGGHWTKLDPTSVNLVANSDNYVYVKRSATDIRFLECEVTQTPRANTFNKVLIAKITTDSANPIAQENYLVNENSVKWKKITEKPVITVTGAMTGTVSLADQNPTLNLSLGTVTTPPANSNDTTIATTAYVQTAVSNAAGFTASSNISVASVSASTMVASSTANATSIITGAIQSRGGIAATNDIWAGGEITAYSDARIKTNIEKITGALDKVDQLNGYTYDRTDIEMKRQTGVLAQEVLKVLPEAVSGSEDTVYGVSYGNMVGLLIEAIKELRLEIDELKGAK